MDLGSANDWNLFEVVGRGNGKGIRPVEIPDKGCRNFTERLSIKSSIVSKFEG